MIAKGEEEVQEEGLGDDKEGYLRQKIADKKQGIGAKGLRKKNKSQGKTMWKTNDSLNFHTIYYQIVKSAQELQLREASEQSRETWQPAWKGSRNSFKLPKRHLKDQ